MNGHDIDELRAELSATTDAALELAEQLAIAAIDGPPSAPPRVAQLARDFQQKRQQVRRLRRAVAVEVAG